MNRFDNQVVLVSGGARGMGASHVKAFIDEGAHVVFGDLLDDEGHQLAERLGDRAHYVRLDVTSRSQWEDAVAKALELGTLAALVNNAGTVALGPIEQGDERAFRTVIDVNQVGCFLGMAAVTPPMLAAGGGSIVNISSAAGLQAVPNATGYVASKWAVRGMTKAAAMALGSRGIRVNSVHPGPIQTPMTDGMTDSSGGQAIPRWGQPEEVSRAVLFLASTEASYITGAELAVDGGMSLGPVIPVG